MAIYGTPDPRRRRPVKKDTVTKEQIELQQRLWVDHFNTKGARFKNPNRNTHKPNK